MLPEGGLLPHSVPSISGLKSSHCGLAGVTTEQARESRQRCQAGAGKEKEVTCPKAQKREGKSPMQRTDNRSDRLRHENQGGPMETSFEFQEKESRCVIRNQRDTLVSCAQQQ